MANTPAFAYLRTSNAANVGADKDSDRRQRAAIRVYAKQTGYEIVDEFYDPAVSGADAIEDRPGFSALLDRIEDNGVRTVLCEDASPGVEAPPDQMTFPKAASIQPVGVMS